MTTILSEVREALALSLALSVPTLATWPDRFTPPIALVALPQTSYLVGGDTFGSFDVSLDVLLVVEHTYSALSDLESLILEVLPLAATSEWSVTGVDSPSISVVAGAGPAECLSTLIHLQIQIKL